MILFSNMVQVNNAALVTNFCPILVKVDGSGLKMLIEKICMKVEEHKISDDFYFEETSLYHAFPNPIQP